MDMKEYMVSYTFKAGVQTVTVEYVGNTATFTVNIKKVVPRIDISDRFTRQIWENTESLRM